jgi:phenylacetate-CoA ligase
LGFHVPEEERLDGADREALQRRKLDALISVVLSSNEFYQRKFRDHGVDPVRDPLASWPMTTRAELERDQSERPPYGTNLSYPSARYRRIHQTSGTGGQPLRWLDTAESWDWWLRCWGIIYRAAGLTDADRVMIPFSFGPFVGFWGAFEAAALGNFCLPAGGMTTVARLRYLMDHAATCVCCTPTYALRMAEVAREERIDLAGSPVRMVIVAGEPGGGIPETRARIESAWGARLFDHAGMTEVGPWGFECAEAPGGLHVMESEFIAEVVDPESFAPVAEGEVGELVLTNLGRLGSPLIRYRTGDLVRLTRGRCRCGRSFARAGGGVLGRIDDMLVVRGNNVYPSAIEGILRGVDAVAEFQIEVVERNSMADLVLRVEPMAGAATAATAEAVASAVQNRLHFRPRVETVEPGSLPRFEMKAKRIVRT